MSDWVPCIKCGVYTSIGMRENHSDATCNHCKEYDDSFYYPQEDIENGDYVEAKHFKGVVTHVGTETQVEVKESQIYDNGETIHLDKANLKPIDQTTLD